MAGQEGAGLRCDDQGLGCELLACLDAGMTCAWYGGATYKGGLAFFARKDKGASLNRKGMVAPSSREEKEDQGPQ